MTDTARRGQHPRTGGGVLLKYRRPNPRGPQRMTDLAFQRCINPRCGRTVDLADTSFRCPECGGLLDVAYDWDRLPVPKSLKQFEAKWANRHDPLDFSGVWRFRDLFPFAPADKIMT